MSESIDYIRACPFCGGPPILINRGNNHPRSKRSSEIVCKGCSLKMVVGAIRHDLAWAEDVVRRKWNQRFEDEELEEAKKAKKNIATSIGCDHEMSWEELEGRIVYEISQNGKDSLYGHAEFCPRGDGDD